MSFNFLARVVVASVFLVVASVFLVVGGCEAPLNLQGILQEKSNFAHRFDQFQAAGKTSEVTVIVGSYGVVLVSKDRGKSWHRKELDGKPPLVDLAICPDKSLVALDYKGNIWLSRDNGDNWDPRKIETTEVPQALTCDQQGTIWVVGSFSTINSSRDMGKSWHQTSFDEDFMFTTVQFINDQQGVITGEFGTVMYTTDAGQTWLRSGPVSNEFYPQAAHFLDLDRGWVVGLNGKIFHTNDRGQSWQEEATGVDAPLYGIAIHGNRLFVVGERGIVLFRDKFGQWSRYDYQSPIQSYLRIALPVNTHDLLVAGGAGAVRLLRTINTEQTVLLMEQSVLTND